MSEGLLLPSTSADTFGRRVRWEPYFNTTDERVPPFACMQLRKPKKFSETKAAKNTDKEDEFYRQHLRGNQIVWDITKPNADGEGRQNPSEFMFNGETPCEPLSYGRRGTFDLPARVLHNGVIDRLPNGVPCGPVKDRWYVLTGGSAWTGLCHDIGFAAGEGQMHTVWVGRSTGKVVSAHGRFPVVASALDANSYLTWPVNPTLLKSLTVKGDFLTVEREGLFKFWFHGQLYSSDGVRGDQLQITLYKKQADEDNGTTHDPEATPYICQREQDIEKSCTVAGGSPSDLQTTKEMVMFGGFENLKVGDGLGLKNTCSKRITLVQGLFSIMYDGQLFDDGSDATDDSSVDSSAS